MAAAPGALTSDHVNYLIFRYLQESGHEKTAKQFAADWHRPHEYHQPEDLPFAHTVHRSELVSVIQNGLAHDDLQARVGRNERQFRWTMGGNVGPRESVEEDGMTERENESRPPSSGKRKGRAPAVGGMRAPDEFPTPAAKRQRVSHESEGPHVNGDRDAMNVDAASASPADAASDANDEESATAESDFDMPGERYDSMDVATQTDLRTGPKTTTLSFTVSKPGARIIKSSWTPSKVETEQDTLLAVGEELCRYYRVPDTSDSEPKSLPHQDEPQLPPNSVITAMAWHPSGRVATCAVDTVEELSGGKQISRQSLVDISRDEGAVTYPREVPLLEPPGVITNIRYSLEGEYILVMRSNFKRSSIQIWQTRPDPEKPQVRLEPHAWRIYEHQVLDAAWQSEDSFVVCGEQNFIRQYTLVRTEDSPLNTEATDATSTMHNLSEQVVDRRDQVLSKQDPASSWDKVCFEPHTSTCMVGSASHPAVACISTTEEFGTTCTYEDRSTSDGGVVALAVAPKRPIDLAKDLLHNHASLWMAARQSGACELWHAVQQESGATRSALVVTLQLGESALALAWSPDGRFVAAAGADVVKIWRCRLAFDSADSEKMTMDTTPLTTWRLRDHDSGDENGEGQGREDEEVKSAEPCLSWSADGERLCFALDKQVSIISFRPPLSTDTAEQEVNGGASP